MFRENRIGTERTDESSSRIRSVPLLFALLTALISALIWSSELQASTDSIRSSCLEHYRATLPEHVRSTLERIPNVRRRELALCYYIRRDSQLVDGWSWTASEVSAFRKTPQFRTMVADVELVRAIFADSNAGYELRVNIAARSLGTQISKWNAVSSVSRAANDFRDSTERFLSQFFERAAAGIVDTSALVDSFGVFLRTYSPRPGRVPTVAVPGLSKHGRLSAFDFKVYRRGRMIAGANSRSIRSRWDRPGWTERLQAAALAASPRFSGPLQVPYEPWHYEYDISDSIATTPRVDLEPDGEQTNGG